jgi:hypothetical protein
VFAVDLDSILAGDATVPDFYVSSVCVRTDEGARSSDEQLHSYDASHLFPSDAIEKDEGKDGDDERYAEQNQEERKHATSSSA